MFTAFLFKKIFDILEPVNKTSQTKDLDLLTATIFIDSVKTKLAYLITGTPITILIQLFWKLGIFLKTAKLILYLYQFYEKRTFL